VATTSEVEVQLDVIAEKISKARGTVRSLISGAQQVATQLNAIPGDHNDVITTIGAYGTSNAYEAAVKAQFDKLVSEFTALVADAEAIAAVSIDD
jgi:tetrahydromethanopterin S-methyltransferase subunit B